MGTDAAAADDLASRTRPIWCRRAEAAGYTDLWSGETSGPDGFTPLALAAAWTENVRLGTGVVGVFQRGPALLAQQAAAMADATAGASRSGSAPHRTGSSRAGTGSRFERPLVEGRGDASTSCAPRSRASARRTGSSSRQPPAQPIPIILAALRGKMLRLAVEKADGAFTNFLPLSGLPKVVEGLDGAPDGFELLCRFFCLPGAREQVEPLARFMFSSYITVPVYEAFFRWLGHGEAIDEMVEAWAAKDREGAAAAAPWELIEEMFIFGEPGARCTSASRAYVDGRHHAPVSPRSRRRTSSAI